MCDLDNREFIIHRIVIQFNVPFLERGGGSLKWQYIRPMSVWFAKLVCVCVCVCVCVGGGGLILAVSGFDHLLIFLNPLGQENFSRYAVLC